MRRRTILFLATVAALGALAPLTGQTDSRAQGFYVVAHPDRAGSALDRKDISNLLLKKVSNWPDGTAAVPIDLPPRSSVREAFSRAVHRRDVASILRFWQRRVFSGTETPPPQARDENAVLDHVRLHAGGIGYVSPRANTEGVVILSIADLEER